MLPSEGGKHIFKNLVSGRMEIQQNLKAVWKQVETIMTIDEEMKALSAKAAKASPKEENCKNHAQFLNVFCSQALPRWRGQNLENGANMPSIMHTNEQKMQLLGFKLVCAYP